MTNRRQSINRIICAKFQASIGTAYTIKCPLHFAQSDFWFKISDESDKNLSLISEWMIEYKQQYQSKRMPDKIDTVPT